jgi:soluble cytochrome b562
MMAKVKKNERQQLKHFMRKAQVALVDAKEFSERARALASVIEEIADSVREPMYELVDALDRIDQILEGQSPIRRLGPG